LFNGENLVGIDARLILLAEHEEGAHFDLLKWIQHRTELCRVLVRQTDFPWLRRYPMLVKQGSLAQGSRSPATKSRWTSTGCPSS
jgi:hypothetical protein